MTRAHDLQVLAAQIGVTPSHSTQASGSGSPLGMAMDDDAEASSQETERTITKTDVPSLFETFQISKAFWVRPSQGLPNLVYPPYPDLIRSAWHGTGPPMRLILTSEFEGEDFAIPSDMNLDVSVGSMEIDGKFVLDTDLSTLAENTFTDHLSDVESAEYEFKMLFEARFAREFAVDSSDQITLADLSIRLEAYGETFRGQLVELQSHLEEKLEEAKTEAERAHQEADRIGREIADKINDEIDQDVDGEDDEDDDEEEDDEDDDFDARYR